MQHKQEPEAHIRGLSVGSETRQAADIEPNAAMSCSQEAAAGSEEDKAAVTSSLLHRHAEAGLEGGLQRQGAEEDQAAYGSVSKQMMSCFCAYLLAMSFGASSAFSAISIPQLEQPGNGFLLTREETSWFASIFLLATFLTCILGGFMGQYLGRKTSLILVSPLFVIGFLLQAFSNSKEILITGRFLVGVASGLVSGPASVYVSEISSPKWRTTLSSGISVFHSLGCLSVYILGFAASWRLVAGLCIVFPLTAILIGFIIPEPPIWLVSIEKYQDANDALTWFTSWSEPKLFVQPFRKGCKNQDLDPSLSHKEAILKLQTINDHPRTAATEPQLNGGFCSRLAKKCQNLALIFRRADVFKPLSIITLLCFTQQFCGVSTLSYYAVSVMMITSSSINEYLAVIVFGIARLLSQLVGSALLLRFRRKLLFVCSAAITATGTILLCLSYDFAHSHKEVNDESRDIKSSIYGYIPLLSIILSAFGYNIGIGPITWSYMAELFPTDIRAEMAGLSNCLANIMTFLVVKMYPAMSDESSGLGFQGTQYFYAAVCVLQILIGLFVLPETKDKRLQDITDKFAETSNVEA